jgi:hypothetical protein
MHCTKSCNSRSGVSCALPSVYPLIIIQRYGVDRGLPYSILAFRLEKGEDEKKCLAVRLKGEFIKNGFYQDVNVKVSYGTSLAPLT